MYKIEYVSDLDFIPHVCWYYETARLEFELAKKVMLHLDVIKLWKFNFWRWKWSLIDNYTFPKYYYHNENLSQGENA